MLALLNMLFIFGNNIKSNYIYSHLQQIGTMVFGCVEEYIRTSSLPTQLKNRIAYRYTA